MIERRVFCTSFACSTTDSVPDTAAHASAYSTTDANSYSTADAMDAREGDNLQRIRKPNLHNVTKELA